MVGNRPNSECAPHTCFSTPHYRALSNAPFRMHSVEYALSPDDSYPIPRAPCQHHDLSGSEA